MLPFQKPKAGLVPVSEKRKPGLPLAAKGSPQREIDLG